MAEKKLSFDRELYVDDGEKDREYTKAARYCLNKPGEETERSV